MIIESRGGCRVHAGKIVILLRRSRTFPESWLTAPDLLDGKGVRIAWHESHLRPLRVGLGGDEMLERVGRPPTGDPPDS